MIDKDYIARHLDLAVLKPTATADDVRCACALASKHGIKSVCVAPAYVKLAASLHNNVSCVIGFPNGNTTPATKYYEAVDALRNGARELDLVVSYGAFLDGDHLPLLIELALVVSAAHQAGCVVKAILEVCYYTPSQLHHVCAICQDSGVDMLKTSTGFALAGATVWAVETMLQYLPTKASGGIKTHLDAEKYLSLGCARIGASNFAELLP